MKDNVEIAKDYTDWIIKTGGYARDMTMRDHFAGLAMQGLFASDAKHDHKDADIFDVVAEAAYKVADAMLKENAK